MDNDININKINSVTSTIQNNDKNIKQVAKDFEELFLQQLLKTSLKDVDIVGETAGGDIVKEMYLEGIAKSTAGSMGISQMLIEHLSNNKNPKKDADDNR